MAGVEHVLEGAERRFVRRMAVRISRYDLDRALAITELRLERLAEAELEVGDLARRSRRAGSRGAGSR